MYRRFAVSLLLIVVLCAGCDGGATISAAVRQGFLNALYGQAPDIQQYRSAAQLVSMGQAVCSDLGAGAGVQQVADRVQLTEGSVALPADDLGALMSAAVGTICPRYRDLLGQ